LSSSILISLQYFLSSFQIAKLIKVSDSHLSLLIQSKALHQETLSFSIASFVTTSLIQDSFLSVFQILLQTSKSDIFSPLISFKSFSEPFSETSIVFSTTLLKTLSHSLFSTTSSIILTSISSSFSSERKRSTSQFSDKSSATFFISESSETISIFSFTSSISEVNKSSQDVNKRDDKINIVNNINLFIFIFNFI
jgi:hypothetical protein